MKKIYTLILFAFAFQAKSQSLIDSLFIRIWNANPGVYENFQFLKNFIDAACARVDSYNYYRYSIPQSQWNLDLVSHRSFNTSNQKTEEVFFNGPQRANFGRALFNYQGGLLSDRIEQRWSAQSSQYVNDRRTIIKRRPDTRPDTVVFQIWDENNSLWENFRREVLSYVSGGAIYETTKVIQDWSVNKWVNNQKEISAFDASNNNILDIASQTWNQDSSKWFNKERVTFTYDGQGKLSIALRETYSQSKTWDISTRSVYTYSGRAVEIVGQEFDAGSGSWQNLFKINFLEQCKSTLSAREIIPFEINVFPNPASSEIQVKATGPVSISLTEMSGKIMWQSSSAFETHQIDLSGFSQGVYLLQISSGRQQEVRRVMKW